MAEENQTNNGPAAAAPAATGVTQEQLQAAIEKARLEERTKLRADIETAEANATALQTRVKELEAENQKLTADLQTLKSAQKPDGGFDAAKLMEETAQRVRSELQGTINELSSQIEEERGVRQRLTLEQLRAKLIQANGGENALIPSLVTGTNEAELIASIQASKAEFNRIMSVAKAQTPSTQQNNGAGGTTVPNIPVPAAGGTNAGGQAVVKTVQEMSLNEYGANRAAVKAKLRGMYPNNAIMQ
jgi:DNA repair exonuclease SbcCD ATPase subunit